MGPTFVEVAGEDIVNKVREQEERSDDEGADPTSTFGDEETFFLHREASSADFSDAANMSLVTCSRTSRECRHSFCTDGCLVAKRKREISLGRKIAVGHF